MIVSYETLRNLATELNGCKIGLLLCDEGHRLKNSGLSRLLIISLMLLIFIVLDEREPNLHRP